ncbi:MAG: glycosyltransferase family 2 protein [Candidatus Methylomirabilales bacterium]
MTEGLLSVSIVIRSHNEERWIVSCLRSVFAQAFRDFEVILVDNGSTDSTVRRAREFPIKVVDIVDYRPGKALNLGIRASSGRYLVFLSGHCIPINREWLSKLITGLADERIAGVYGRQQPMTFSSPQDKRDLIITFGLDRRIQEKDPFFHSANSAIRRDVWEKIPFDETVTSIEDRLWAEKALKQGYHILYEPEASVYHHHGIHHTNHEQRARSTVQVLDHIHKNDPRYQAGVLDAENLDIVALVPVRGESPLSNGQPVLRHTLAAAYASQYVKETLVLTDHPATAQYAEQHGAVVPFLRDAEYSQGHVDLNTVYAYCLERLEEQGRYADLIVTLELTYPFRPSGLVDDLIVHLLLGGYDSVLPVRSEFNPCWTEEDGGPRRIDIGEVPRNLKPPLRVGLKGLGCVTHPEFLRQGRLLGNVVGLLQIDDPYAALEVRSEEDARLLSRLLAEHALRHA